MLYIKKQSIQNVDDLRRALQSAVEIEHATIPAYLTALHSIMPGTNKEIAALLQSIVIEEMLHMSIAANVLNAVGGQPKINSPDFIPQYPGPLPMGIGSEPGKPFIVPLQKLSLELVRGIFMVIEEPEDPLHFPVKALAKAALDQDYHTLGQFYAALEAAIVRLGQGIFTGDPARQVTTPFFPDLTAVTDVASACKGLTLIVRQGEGTKKSPLDPEGAPAHYYRYAEIANGRMLMPDTSVPQGFSYSGAKVPFDPAGVYPMVDNPPVVPLPPGSLAARLADQFDATYSSLLNALDGAFNGEPSRLDATVGLMYSLKLSAQKLMSTPIPGRSDNAGPRYLYTARPDGAPAHPPKAAA